MSGFCSFDTSDVPRPADPAVCPAERRADGGGGAAPVDVAGVLSAGPRRRRAPRRLRPRDGRAAAPARSAAGGHPVAGAGPAPRRPARYAHRPAVVTLTPDTGAGKFGS